MGTPPHPTISTLSMNHYCPAICRKRLSAPDLEGLQVAGLGESTEWGWGMRTKPDGQVEVVSVERPQKAFEQGV